ncbi:hypothetical protein D6D20_10323 [Aureobasidium pullulans]|uniref:Uncharacterized protein n=1 Tax=Aureobasidium pullulans TaxID=5580 RepID=A0A4V4ILG4_AURPU|nr:hypothetical protein D6D20_10323 [Aureobasidium pullulans]
MSPSSDLAIQTARAALNLPALPAGNAATTATPSAQSVQPSALPASNAATTATPPAQSAELSAPAVGNPAPTASTLESLSLSDDVVTIPRALFEAHAAELARLGIYEGMTK